MVRRIMLAILGFVFLKCNSMISNSTNRRTASDRRTLFPRKKNPYFCGFLRLELYYAFLEGQSACSLYRSDVIVRGHFATFFLFYNFTNWDQLADFFDVPRLCVTEHLQAQTQAVNLTH